MRSYKCLSKSEYSFEQYKLVTIRDEDKYLILQWRNEQIINLRQKKTLSREQQEKYFATVVLDLFVQEKPQQLLFSFLENGLFVGYGGFVHIDWGSKNAEVSFLIETKFALDEKKWAYTFSIYIQILKYIAKAELGFVKLHTFGYETEPYIFKFKVLLDLNFVEEARLKKHIMIENKFHDVLIHSYFL